MGADGLSEECDDDHRGLRLRDGDKRTNPKRGKYPVRGANSSRGWHAAWLEPDVGEIHDGKEKKAEASAEEPHRIR